MAAGIDFGLALDVVWKVGTLVGFAWMYMANRNKATNIRITELEKKFDKSTDDLGERITRVETDMQHAPTHSDLADLHERINTVAQSLNNMVGEMSGMKTTLNLIHQFLMTGGRK